MGRRTFSQSPRSSTTSMRRVNSPPGAAPEGWGFSMVRDGSGCTGEVKMSTVGCLATATLATVASTVVVGAAVVGARLVTVVGAGPVVAGAAVGSSPPPHAVRASIVTTPAAILARRSTATMVAARRKAPGAPPIAPDLADAGPGLAPGRRRHWGTIAAAAEHADGQQDETDGQQAYHAGQGDLCRPGRAAADLLELDG